MKGVSMSALRRRADALPPSSSPAAARRNKKAFSSRCIWDEKTPCCHPNCRALARPLESAVRGAGPRISPPAPEADSNKARLRLAPTAVSLSAPALYCFPSTQRIRYEKDKNIISHYTPKCKSFGENFRHFAPILPLSRKSLQKCHRLCVRVFLIFGISHAIMNVADNLHSIEQRPQGFSAAGGFRRKAI